MERPDYSRSWGGRSARAAPRNGQCVMSTTEKAPDAPIVADLAALLTDVELTQGLALLQIRQPLTSSMSSR